MGWNDAHGRLPFTNATRMWDQAPNGTSAVVVLRFFFGANVGSGVSSRSQCAPDALTVRLERSAASTSSIKVIVPSAASTRRGFMV